MGTNVRMRINMNLWGSSEVGATTGESEAKGDIEHNKGGTFVSTRASPAASAEKDAAASQDQAPATTSVICKYDFYCKHND